MKFDRSPPEDAAIAQGLASLKRQGGTVLVVGAATTAHADACDRFLGDEDHERVFVRTDRAVRPDEASTDAAVVERAVPTRGASAEAAAPSPIDVTMLTADVESAMLEAAAADETVRVCFDSLRPLVDVVDWPALVSFLDSVRETARETGAVVHFHLPAMTEAVPSDLFEAVDAVVELNAQGHATYQQWHLPETGKTSEWVEI
jgi:NAD(P)-dependent dehydrogenase (short-subunit alcohol dehydrogenase family)